MLNLILSLTLPRNLKLSEERRNSPNILYKDHIWRLDRIFTKHSLLECRQQSIKSLLFNKTYHYTWAKYGVQLHMFSELTRFPILSSLAVESQLPFVLAEISIIVYLVYRSESLHSRQQYTMGERCSLRFLWVWRKRGMGEDWNSSSFIVLTALDSS